MVILKSNQNEKFLQNSIFFHRPTSNEISISNGYEVDHSNDNHLRDDDDLSNDDQEKEFEEELDDIDTIQQIQNNMSAPSGAVEMNPQKTIRSGRFLFLSKIPLVHFIKIDNRHLIFV